MGPWGHETLLPSFRRQLLWQNQAGHDYEEQGVSLTHVFGITDTIRAQHLTSRILFQAKFSVYILYSQD